MVGEVGFLQRYEIENALRKAVKAQKEWSILPLEERKLKVNQFIKTFTEGADAIAKEISMQMGKPVKQSHNEIKGFVFRTESFVAQAEQALKPQIVEQPAPDRLGTTVPLPWPYLPDQHKCEGVSLGKSSKKGETKPVFHRSVSREPVGIVAIVAPWNYPLLTVCNALIPAVLAGNAVVIKPSLITALTGQRIAKAFETVGFPDGLVQNLIVSHEDFSNHILREPKVGYVSFTGSNEGGAKVLLEAATHGHFMGVGLELGGKDAMYIAEDADIDDAVANAVDGAAYNAGQSCCATERIYVHAKHYDKFLERAKQLLSEYRLGDPLNETTTMGPLALEKAPARLEQLVYDARRRGANVILGGRATGDRRTFFQPTLVADAAPSMALIQEEAFGPIVTVQKVYDDQHAIEQVNNSRYGLTASIWTQSVERAEWFAQRADVGTVFMNRCDYLDPFLSWSGRKDSGMGNSMGMAGFAAVTQLKNRHFKITQ